MFNYCYAVWNIKKVIVIEKIFTFILAAIYL